MVSTTKMTTRNLRIVGKSSSKPPKNTVSKSRQGLSPNSRLGARHKCMKLRTIYNHHLVSFHFQIDKTDGKARAGRFFTPHGEVQTPVFMPVGTLATVKGVPQDTLEELGVQILQIGRA